MLNRWKTNQRIKKKRLGRRVEYKFLLFFCITLAQQDQAYPGVAERQMAEGKRGDRFQLRRACPWCGSSLATACTVVVDIIAPWQQAEETSA